LIEEACDEIARFKQLYADMQQKTSLAGRSKSTLDNYTRCLAKMALHYNRLPTELDIDQVNDYLYLMQQQHKTPSESYFKFTVYGLRFAYRMYGMKDKRIELPSIRKEKKLPIVLSQEEVKRILHAPTLLRHRILLGLLYGCGLRCFEVRNICLKTRNIWERRQNDMHTAHICPVRNH
jgi:site-specific recombinase XerD